MTPPHRPRRGGVRRSRIGAAAAVAVGIGLAGTPGLPRVVNDGLTAGLGAGLQFVKAYMVFLTDLLLNNLKVVAIAAAVLLLAKLASGLSLQRRRADVRKWTEHED
ncbi:hypothetical protein [Azospirillum thermophilum]|uniref:Uncharacterized protein n=1 Tax=Azospirillum thermophilum TaxID=2202148 RepID=A0A2S2CNM1_9PROT|nr:hypothetical protein [Azospirillum thermophilum]AWK86123.1 hypothetical protein DEW08_07540 [Azospirillum thermophilum]